MIKEIILFKFLGESLVNKEKLFVIDYELVKNVVF